MATEIQTAERVWPVLASVVFVPHSENEYQRIVRLLDALIDVVGENENHPLEIISKTLCGCIISVLTAYDF